MILTDVDKLKGQADLPAGVRQAVDYLTGLNGSEPEDGRVDIDGDKVFALIQSYESRPQTDPMRFEAHRRYADVQFVLKGREVMGFAPLDQIQITDPYMTEKDALLGTLPRAQATLIHMRQGQAIVLYPEDAHAPGLQDGGPEPVRKIVVKVLLDR